MRGIHMGRVGFSIGAVRDLADHGPRYTARVALAFTPLPCPTPACGRRSFPRLRALKHFLLSHCMRKLRDCGTIHRTCHGCIWNAFADASGFAG
jgi:hypothetical protein